MKVAVVCFFMLFLVYGVVLEQPASDDHLVATPNLAESSSSDEELVLSSDDAVPIVKEEETTGFLQILWNIIPFDVYSAKILSQMQNSTQDVNASAKQNETSTPSPLPNKPASSSSPSSSSSSSSSLDPAMIFGIPDTSIPSTLEAASLPLSSLSLLSLLSNVRDKFNYASMDCGANVLSVNREAKDATSILLTSKDRYMLNPCSVSKRYVVLELCEEIGIQILAIANYEFFSSMLKGFQVFGTNRYPPQQWTPIGNFTAQNVRRLQYFVLPEPLWFKYIRIQFDTYYGDEYYCPISELRVHGTTVVDDITLQIERDSREISELANALRSPFRAYQPPVQPQPNLQALSSDYHPPIHRHPEAMGEEEDDEDDPLKQGRVEDSWRALLDDTGNLLKGLEDTFKQSFQRIRNGIEENLYNHFDHAGENGGTEVDYVCECNTEDGNCDCALAVGDGERAVDTPSETKTDSTSTSTSPSLSPSPSPSPSTSPDPNPPTTSPPSPNPLPHEHSDTTTESKSTEQDKTTNTNTHIDTSDTTDTSLTPTPTPTPTPPLSDHPELPPVVPPAAIEPPALPHPPHLEDESRNNHGDEKGDKTNEDTTNNNNNPSIGNPPTSPTSTPPSTEHPEENVEHLGNTTLHKDNTKIKQPTKVPRPKNNNPTNKPKKDKQTQINTNTNTNSNNNNKNNKNNIPLIEQCINLQSPVHLLDDVCYINITTPCIPQDTEPSTSLPHHTSPSPSQSPSPSPSPSQPLSPEVPPAPTEAPPVTSIAPASEEEEGGGRKRAHPSDAYDREPTTGTYPNTGFALGSAPQNIFKSLINRIKTLEINQSIAAVYLADLTTFYAEAFAKMSQMIARLESANTNMYDFVQNSTKKFMAKQKHLTDQVEELRAERSHMQSNMSVLIREIQVLSEVTLLLKTQQETQQWINIFTAGAVGALLICVIWRSNGNNISSNNINGFSNARYKTKSSPPILKLSRSVGASMNLIHPDFSPKRKRRHSIGHSLSPNWTRHKKGDEEEEEDEENKSSDSNSDWEMDADDEISNTYFKNDEQDILDGDEIIVSPPRQQPEHKIPHLKKSASTNTIDATHRPKSDFLRFLFM